MRNVKIRNGRDGENVFAAVLQTQFRVRKPVSELND